MNMIKQMMVVAFASIMLMGSAMADEMGAKHKVVIQVSSADPLIQKIALNNAVNVQKHYGPGEADVEVVAYGPGLSILTMSKKNKQAKRVEGLAMSDITFSACGNTMKKVTKKKGKAPKLIEGVKVVPAGVVRIMELQAKGYAYIRP
jgi:intracellular sulfur oxidation DsrE/DsrF family protein